MEIQWNKKAIKALNQEVAKIAQRSSSNTQKAADIVSAAQKLGIHYEKNAIKKMLENKQIPEFKV